MKEQEMERLRQRAHREYVEEKALIERQGSALNARAENLDARHAARLEAIGWMVENETVDGLDGRQSNSLKDQVEAAVSQCEHRFTRMCVESELEEKMNSLRPSRGTVVRELESLVHEGALRIAVQGRGRRATVYEKVSLAFEQ